MADRRARLHQRLTPAQEHAFGVGERDPPVGLREGEKKPVLHPTVGVLSRHASLRPIHGALARQLPTRD